METAESTASTGEAPRAPIALFKKRGAKAEGSFRKRQATPPPAGSDSDDSDFSSDSESGRRLKRRKKSTGTVFATSTAQTPSSRDLTATVFEADRSVAITSSNDATKQSNWHTEDLDDASSSKNPPSAQIPDGTYKGLAHQTSFIQKNPNAPDRKFGPIKAATNIRTITVTDYAPEVCKDFKTSGFVALVRPASISMIALTIWRAGSWTGSGRASPKERRISGVPWLRVPTETGLKMMMTAARRRPCWRTYHSPVSYARNRIMSRS